MRLSSARVERLFEEAAQIQDRQQYVLDSLPVAQIQELIKRRQEEDPTLTHDRIATAAGYKHRSTLLRAIGLAPTARTVKNGKEYPPKLNSQIDVAAASRIVRAIGFAPHEIPGL
jgi:hypothetical protein